MIQPGMEGEWSHPSGMTFYEPAKDGKPIRWTVLEIKSGVHNRLTREIIQYVSFLPRKSMCSIV